MVSLRAPDDLLTSDDAEGGTTPGEVDAADLISGERDPTDTQRVDEPDLGEQTSRMLTHAVTSTETSMGLLHTDKNTTLVQWPPLGNVKYSPSDTVTRLITTAISRHKFVSMWTKMHKTFQNVRRCSMNGFRCSLDT